MNYIGIDYHKKYSVVTAIDKEGALISSRRIQNTIEDVREFVGGLPGESMAVLESGRTWGVMYDLLEQMKGITSIQLAHPYKVRAIAEAKVKTDQIDAAMLAQLLRADLIPAAYIPDKTTRLRKELLRHRAFLVGQRTKVKNRIHFLLDRLHIAPPAVTDLFGARGINFLKKLPLKGIDGELMREHIALLEMLNTLIKDAGREIADELKTDKRVEIIRSVPGFGDVFSPLVALEIDDIKRFSCSQKLTAYAGLVPSTRSSGGKVFHGKLIKTSNKWLRWAFVEASWAAIRTSPYCKQFYMERKRRIGTNKAIVSLARRLAEIMWYVLTENRPYEERAYPCKPKRVDNNPPSPSWIPSR